MDIIVASTAVFVQMVHGIHQTVTRTLSVMQELVVNATQLRMGALLTIVAAKIPLKPILIVQKKQNVLKKEHVRVYRVMGVSVLMGQKHHQIVNKLISPISINRGLFFHAIFKEDFIIPFALSNFNISGDNCYHLGCAVLFWQY